MAKKAPIPMVQCFGRKKITVAVTTRKQGKGIIKINNCPIKLMEPEILCFKAIELILLLNRSCFNDINMKIHVKGQVSIKASKGVPRFANWSCSCHPREASAIWQNLDLLLTESNSVDQIYAHKWVIKGGN